MTQFEANPEPVNPQEFMDFNVDVEGIGGIDEYLEGGSAADAEGSPDDDSPQGPGEASPGDDPGAGWDVGPDGEDMLGDR